MKSLQHDNRDVAESISTSRNAVHADVSQQTNGEKPAASHAAPATTLPGAMEHPILQLSDDKFRNTPVSEMFEWYGQAGGGGTCAEDFGYKLIGSFVQYILSVCSGV